MKTAISIPDELFAEAEKLARRLKKSRIELYSHALREYVARHGPDYVTETVDRICAESPPEKDFARAIKARSGGQTSPRHRGQNPGSGDPSLSCKGTRSIAVGSIRPSAWH
jgi:hypothetical protein